MNAKRFQSGRLTLDIGEMPVISALITDAVSVVSDPRASSVEIEGVIVRDQALTAQMLRVVNGASYGFSRRIETIREAVVLLGTRKIQSIAGAMMSSRFFAKPIDDLADPAMLWAHSLAASVWAMEIIEHRKIWHAQSAVMAALLHDIGIVALCQYATDAYRVVLQKSREEQTHHVEIERRELHTDHAHIGGILCARWMFPVGLTQLVSNHHTEECPPDDDLAVVILADFLAHTHGHKPFAWAAERGVPPDLLENLRLGDDEMLELNEKCDQVNDRVSALMSVTSSD